MQSIWYLKTGNKKVNYRKQIARQHLCHKNYRQVWGSVVDLKIFLSSSLITVQNLVAVSHHAGACRSQKFRRVSSTLLQ